MNEKELDLLRKLARIVEKNQPYHLNLLDELHANENAHTRILVKLLQYKASGKFIFLKSFLRYLEEYGFSVEKINFPKITYEDNHIDASINDTNYCVIIENKINGAVDQEKQIERYLEDAKARYKANAEDIYLIYLTADGGKIISEISLTEKAKKILNFENPEKSGRFIALNYRDHILPWLKNDVSENCSKEEATLNHAIEQYIDYLKGRFLLREGEKEMSDKIGEQFWRELVDLSSDKERYNIIQKMQDDIDELQRFLPAMRNDLIRKAPSLNLKEAARLFSLKYLGIETPEYLTSKDENYAINISHTSGFVCVDLWAHEPGKRWTPRKEDLHEIKSFAPLKNLGLKIVNSDDLPEYNEYGYYYRILFPTFEDGEKILHAINKLEGIDFNFNFSS